MKLVPPSLDYRHSYLGALEEYDADPVDALGFEREAARGNLEEFVRNCEAWARGEDLIDGWVPQSSFWLVDGAGYVGSLHIRHELTPSLRLFGGHIGYAVRPSRRRQGNGTLMLGLSLPEAKALGIESALLTCDSTNVASAKVIEANGGVLEDEIMLADRRVPTRRYWIDLSRYPAQ